MLHVTVAGNPFKVKVFSFFFFFLNQHELLFHSVCISNIYIKFLCVFLLAVHKV